MDLFKEILVEVLAKEQIDITFANLKLSAVDVVEMESYKALQKLNHHRLEAGGFVVAAKAA